MPTSGRGFDAAGYKTAFRTACQQRGIDPLSGASVYQAANISAEHRKAEKRAQAQAERDSQYGAWWTKPEKWLDFPPDHSDIERIVFAHLLQVALRLSLMQLQSEMAETAAREYA